MNREDNFAWFVEEIDNSLIFMLRDGKEMLGSYYADSISINGTDTVSVKFANINDLTNFIDYSLVRFVNSLDRADIIDIPIKKIYDLFKIAKNDDNGAIYLKDINSFAVFSDKVISDGYAIIPYMIKELEPELINLLKRIASFDDLNMNEKIDVLENLNLISYHKTKEREDLKR